MKYSRLKTVVTSNMDYCFAGAIDDADACELSLADGSRVGDAYPADPFTVKVRLKQDHPGIKLPSLIGNTRKLLMLAAPAIAVLEQHLDLGEYETFPFSLINHKGRVHSRDYLFVNPLGTFDVAAPSSDFVRFPSGKIYGCKKWVLDASKLSGIPDLVRPAEVSTHYLVSERFVALVQAQQLTNFEFEETRSLDDDTPAER